MSSRDRIIRLLSPGRFNRWGLLVALLLLAVAGARIWYHTPTSQITAVDKQANIAGPYTLSRQANPPQTIVSDSNGMWLATFTDNTRTVQLTGPERSFAEPQTTKATVSHATWVRVLPEPFAGTVDQVWLAQALQDNNDAQPDILAIAMQYITAAPAVSVGGITVAGDASYGPLVGNKRKEGADFNDYLGSNWFYGKEVDRPEAQQLRSLDCSGYTRMVWGYRSGMPLDGPTSITGTTETSVKALARRAYQIQTSTPGIMLTPDTKAQVTDFSQLSIGDIVFFDANKNDGTQIDHDGMFIGKDNKDHYRFISSRKTADGPTMGDIGGVSILDGKGFYANAYRSALRF